MSVHLQLFEHKTVAAERNIHKLPNLLFMKSKSLKTTNDCLSVSRLQGDGMGGRLDRDVTRTGVEMPASTFEMVIVIAVISVEANPGSVEQAVKTHIESRQSRFSHNTVCWGLRCLFQAQPTAAYRRCGI